MKAKYKTKQMWHDLVDRFRKRLGIWKRKYLTKGGRLVLIHSTLASLPVYLMSIFPIPVSITDMIESIICRFLWGTSQEAKRYHLLAWEQVCLSKEWGGLGIIRIREMNNALLTKWIWRLGNELWRKIIIGKYGIDKMGRYTVKTLQTHGCTIWE